MTSINLFPNVVINDLQEFYIIAGDDRTLTFNVYDSGSAAVNLAGATVTWRMAYYGRSDAVLTKSGVLAGSPNNRFTVSLVPSDTNGLSGKFIHQYTIVASSGSYFRPSQGIIYIKQAIA